MNECCTLQTVATQVLPLTVFAVQEAKEQRDSCAAVRAILIVYLILPQDVQTEIVVATPLEIEVGHLAFASPGTTEHEVQGPIPF